MQDPTHSQALKLQTINFQEDLVEKVRLLSISVIVVYYLKFGSSTAAFLFRLFVHSLLSKSQVVSNQLRRVSLRVHNVRRIPGLPSTINGTENNNDANANSNSNPLMPGTFTVPNNTIEELSEAEIEASVNETQRKVRWVLFHCAFTFNCISIILALIWPVDFISKAEPYRLRSASFGNTPSPFANQNGLIGGELRSGLFVQLVGEQLPNSNFWSNVSIVLLEFLILSLQFGQYILTAYNFAEPPIVLPTAGAHDANSPNTGAEEDDTSNGIVLVTTIRPVEVLNDLLEKRYESTTTTSPIAGADLV
ncbi:LAFA_0G11298g1_1 [Lachancea sp. 'fantastica']|nr:LAFA_0G11298g1_1 [Lachancea sp. 'fantastica']